MPIYSENFATRDLNVDNVEPSFKQSLQATISRTFEDNSANLHFDKQQIEELNNPYKKETILTDTGPKIVNTPLPVTKLSNVEADAFIAEQGLAGHLKVEGDKYSKAGLAYLIDRHKRYLQNQDIDERTPYSFTGTPVRLAASFAVGIIDPINAATMFLPIGQAIKPLAMAAKYGESIAGRAAARAGMGAFEGAVTSVPNEIVNMKIKNELHEEYTVLDMMAGVAFGGAFGGGFGALHAGRYKEQRMMFKELQQKNVSLISPESMIKAKEAAGVSTEPYVPKTAEGVAVEITGGNNTLPVEGRHVPFKYEVVDAADLNPATDKAENQARDRTGFSSQRQIDEIANKLDFNLLHQAPTMTDGAPVLSKDGAIIAGNGRTLGIKQAYATGKGQSYKGPLLEKLKDMGIPASSIKGMKDPVLVRRLSEDVDIRKAAVESNERGSMRMSALENAQVDAERVDLTHFTATDDGELNVPTNKDAISKWIDSYPVEQQSALRDVDGLLSSEGATRLKNAVLFKAYGDSPVLRRLVDSADTDNRNIANALVRVAPRVAEAKATIERGALHDLDISRDVEMAVTKFEELKSQGFKVSDYFKQVQFFDDGMEPTSKQILQFIGENSRSPRKLSDALSNYYTELDKLGDPRQGSMFEAMMTSKQDLFLKAIKDIDDRAYELIDAAHPETRKEAFATSLGTMIQDHRPIAAESIIKADSRVGGATREDITEGLNESIKQENSFTGDDLESLKAVNDLVREKAKDIPTNYENSGLIKGNESLAKEIDYMETKLKAGIYFSRKAGEKVNQPVPEHSKVTEEEKNLITQHNISEEGLLHVKKMGGLAAPIIAVTKHSQPLANFGEISLLGTRDLAEQARIFGADIYSPRYAKNNITKIFTAANEHKIIKELHPFSKLDSSGQNDFNNLHDNPRMKLKFLSDKGILPEVEYEKPTTENMELLDKYKGFINSDETLQGINGSALSTKLRESAVFRQLVKDELEPKYKANGRELKEESLTNILRSRALELGNTTKMLEKPQPDFYSMRKKVGALIDEHSNEYNNFVKDFETKYNPKEKFWVGRNEKTGKDIYVDHTLNNVIKYLIKDLRGGENFMGGLGMIRSYFTPEFKNTKEVKLNQDRLITTDEFEDIKSDMADRLLNIQKTLGEIRDTNYLDTLTSSIFEESAKVGVRKALQLHELPLDHANSEKLINDFESFIKDLKEMPTEYFEGKLPRAVDISEFHTAIVPHNISPEARGFLSEKGLNIREYGREENQTDVITRVAEANPELRYSKGMGGDTPSAVLFDALTKAFGEDTRTIIERGDVAIANTVKDLPQFEGVKYFSDTKAMFDGKRTWIVADMVTAAEAKGILLHEVGVHANLENWLGTDFYNQAIKDIHSLLDNDDPAVVWARSQVPEETNPAHVDQEIMAYLVEKNPELPLVRKILSQIKTWIIQNFPALQGKWKLNADDFTTLATASLRAYAREVESPRSQAKTKLKLSVKNFNNLVDDFYADRLTGDKRLTLGETSDVLQMLGAKPHDMELFYSDMQKITRPEDGKKRGHNLSADEVKQLPESMDDPIVVLQSHDNNKVIVTEIKDYQDRNVIVAVELDHKHAQVKEINRIASAYGKNEHGPDGLDPINWFEMQVVEHGNLLYINKEKSRKSGGPKGLQSPRVSEYLDSQKDIIKDETDLVKFKENKYQQKPMYSRGINPEQHLEQFQKEIDAWSVIVAKVESFDSAIKASFDFVGNSEAMAINMSRHIDMEGINSELFNMDDLKEMAKTVYRAYDSNLRRGMDSIKAYDVATTKGIETFKRAALEQKKNAIDTAMKRGRMMRDAELNPNKVKYLKSLILGNSVTTENSRAHTAARIAGAMQLQAEGAFMADLELHNLVDWYRHNVQWQDTIKAMEALEFKKDTSKFAPESVKLAELIGKHYDNGLLALSEAGASVNKFRRYYMNNRNAHNQTRIHAVGEAAWVKDGRELFDLKTMADNMSITEAEVIALLPTMHKEFSSGLHELTGDTEFKLSEAEEAAKLFLPGSKTPNRIGNRVNKSRVILFKDADAFTKYFEKYGSGNFASSVHSTIGNTSHYAGLIKSLGVKHRENVHWITDKLIKDAKNPEEAEALRKFKADIDTQVDFLDGSANQVGNVKAARIMGVVRTAMRMAQLGLAVASQFSDLATVGAHMNTYGKSYLATIPNVLSKIFLPNMIEKDKKHIITNLGVFNRSMIAEAYHLTGEYDNVTGALSKMQNLFFKVNLQNWATYRTKMAASDCFLNHMGQAASDSYADLDINIKHQLTGYGIKEKDWELLRQSSKKMKDGNVYLDGSGLESIRDSILQHVVDTHNINDVTIANRLTDDYTKSLRDNYRQFVMDGIGRMIMEPSARAQYTARMGNNAKAGTWSGEFFRAFAMYKTFNIELIQNTLSHALYDNKKGTASVVMGMAKYALTAIATGYMAMTLKDMAKGLIPRPADDYRTWLAAMLQGGAIPILGDFLFGETSRFGNSSIASAVGPMSGLAENSLKVLSGLATLPTAKNSTERKQKINQTFNTAVNTVLNNTPFINLFYVRAVLNYLFLYNLQEWMRPGSLARMQQSAQADRGQKYYMPPSKFRLGQ